MKDAKKRYLSFLYTPNARGFQVTVRLKDRPGALGNVLEILRRYINLTNSVSYSTSGGKAIWSGFGKALSRSLTQGTLRRAISKSKFVEESWVAGSRGGLVVDTFHSGVELGPGEPLITMSIRGAASMFDRLTRDFGTGGETILFEEGVALGRANGEYLKAAFGARFVRRRLRDLAGLYGTMGWGRTRVSVGKKGSVIHARVDDCFECSRGRNSRKGCAFRRGHLTGIVSSFLQKEIASEERKCRFRGDGYCEFLLTTKSASRKA